jgi:hypothetical protein
MLENITEIPSSPPLALLLLTVAGAVSILMIASSLILVLLETFRTSSRIRNYGIVVAFFVLALSASVSFGADPETVPALWPSESEYPSCQCQSFTCNCNCSGGDARWTYDKTSTVVPYTWPETPNPPPVTHAKIIGGWNDGTAKTSTRCWVKVDKPYCPSGYQPDGPDTCRKQSPCASKGGQAVDDGSLDFGDGSNQKLSMSFTRREDDNYVGQTFCSGGCLAAVDKEVGSSGGYFDGKYVGQFSAKFSGQSCPGGASQVSPKTTPALIPKTTPEYDCVSKGMGYGYVNETVKCVAQSETKATEKKTSEVTKADGSKTKETRSDNTVCGNGVCITTTTIITTEYNSSGTAVGSQTKTESTSKPDPNSGLGTGGAGTGTGKDGMSCGGPGQPVCAVKVDETGTPTDLSSITAQKQALEGAMDEYKNKLNEVIGPKQWGITWNYSLPAGTCTALQFGAGRFVAALDICKPLGYVRDLWSYVIYFLTGLYIWRSARDALNVI